LPYRAAWQETVGSLFNARILMTPVNFACEGCGLALAVLDKTSAEPVLRLAKGLTFRADGGATCPDCGHETKVNFSSLGAQTAYGAAN
jgi:hypothetical protein